MNRVLQNGLWVCLVAAVWTFPIGRANAVDVEAVAGQQPPMMAESVATAEKDGSDEPADPPPFDYDPYKVLVWWICDDPSMPVASVAGDLTATLNRDFYALWRTEIRAAPASVATMARRDIARLSYEALTAADPVLAIKRDHPQAVRLRIFDNVVEFVDKVKTADWRARQLTAAMRQSGDQRVDAFAAKLESIDQSMVDAWADPSTEAVLTSRGIATTLREPEAKVIDAPAGDLIADQIESFDKIFLVKMDTLAVEPTVTVIELDRLMRHFGAPTTESLGEQNRQRLDVVAAAIRDSFRPIVRVDNAGKKNATGTLRGGGLIVEPSNPGLIAVGDILEPMLRKEDRNGNPFVIGPLDWSFLIANAVDGPVIEMDYWSGRSGGLQGRQNNRTFRMALRVRPRGRGSELRLHAKGDPDDSLVGYEIYEKNLETDEMSFVGRTDWKGTLQIQPSDGPFRLLYVKNGGAVLARLPIVPGLHRQDVANLIGDDDRLHAEAYVRGVENAILDLVAVRELYKARINLRLERGEIDKAEKLLQQLRDQPTSRELNDAIGKRKVVFLDTITNRNQLAKVENMFGTTQDLLAKFITPKLLEDLELAFLKANREAGGAEE